MKAGKRLRPHPERHQLDTSGLLVQETQHHALAVQGWERGHAHVDLAVVHTQADAPILGHAPFGDIQLGHDLEPAHDGRRETGRWRYGVLEDAVHAVAHAETVLVGLQVDVRGACVQRLEQQQVHDLHDRRLVGEAHQVVERRVGLPHGPHVVSQARDDSLGRHGVG